VTPDIVMSFNNLVFGNSLDKLRHTRSVAYSVELVLLNKHQISGGKAYLHCYLVFLRNDLHCVRKNIKLYSLLFEGLPKP